MRKTTGTNGAKAQADHVQEIETIENRRHGGPVATTPGSEWASEDARAKASGPENRNQAFAGVVASDDRGRGMFHQEGPGGANWQGAGTTKLEDPTKETPKTVL